MRFRYFFRGVSGLAVRAPIPSHLLWHGWSADRKIASFANDIEIIFSFVHNLLRYLAYDIRRFHFISPVLGFGSFLM